MAGLKCPICDAFTSAPPENFPVEVYKVKSYTMYPKVLKEEAFTTAISRGRPTYGILICQACGKRFVAEEGYNGSWTSVYPIQHIAAPKEIPEPIKGRFEEASLCFAVGAHDACVSMCQAALEGLWCERRVSGLNELKNKGVISLTLFDRATEIRLWGNIVKHELIQEAVNKEDAEQLLSYLEVILNTVYVEPARLSALRQKREGLDKPSKA